MKGDDRHAILIKPDNSKYTETIQSGIFDRDILCAQCDAILGRLDEYGYTVFKSFPTDKDHLVVDRDRMPIGYDLRCDNVQKAQKFLLSVLWRASVTKHDFFSRVSLGDKYENKIRRIINNDEKVMPEDFEFIIIRTFDHPYDGGLMPPWGSRYDGIYSYTFYLPHFKIIIRADRRQFRDPFSFCRFLEGSQPQAVRLKYSGTSESRYLQSVAASLRDREVRMLPTKKCEG